MVDNVISHYCNLPAHILMADAQQTQVSFSHGKLTIINQAIQTIPEYIGKQHGKDTTQLSITFCELKNVSNLEEFVNLTSLILDNNEIGDDYNTFPVSPNLVTFWINSNNLTNLDTFLSKNTRKISKIKLSQPS